MEHIGIDVHKNSCQVCILSQDGALIERRINALTRAVDLFVRCYNARQLRKRQYPRYPAPLAAMI